MTTHLSIHLFIYPAFSFVLSIIPPSPVQHKYSIHMHCSNFLKSAGLYTLTMNSLTHIHVFTHNSAYSSYNSEVAYPQVSFPGLSCLSLPVSYKASLLWGRDRCGFYCLCLLISQQWIHLSHILLSPVLTQPPSLPPPTPPPPLSVFLCPFVFTSDMGLSYRFSLSHTLVIFFPFLFFCCVSPASLSPSIPFFLHLITTPPSAPGPSFTSQALSREYTYGRWLELEIVWKLFDCMWM